MKKAKKYDVAWCLKTEQRLEIKKKKHANF
jgi:hypothetical protein